MAGHSTVAEHIFSLKFLSLVHKFLGKNVPARENTKDWKFQGPTRTFIAKSELAQEWKCCELDGAFHFMVLSGGLGSVAHSNWSSVAGRIVS